jgi:hypothetical protein
MPQRKMNKEVLDLVSTNPKVLIHIYIGVLLRNPSQGGCARVGGLTAWGGGGSESQGRQWSGNPKI